MTSPPPLLLDTYYHIFNRGINRENIFIEERNYKHFLALYSRYIEPVAETYAYCLLHNHFHLLVKIKSENEIGEISASKKFSDFFNAYAKTINHAYTRTGSLFQHPFGRVMLTNDRQFWNVIAYIHQNPQKHQFVNDFRNWKWSSYTSILGTKPTRLQRASVLEWFGGKQQYLDLHTQWVGEAHSKWFAQDDED